MVDIENVERKFINMIESNEFKKLQEQVFTYKEKN